MNRVISLSATRPLRTEAYSVDGWIILAAASVLIAGITAFLISPKLGLLALGLPLAPLFIVAPDRAVLLLAAAIPFDALASLGPPGTLTVTKLIAAGVIGGWGIHVLLTRTRLRIGLGGYFLLAYLILATTSILWTPAPEAALTHLLPTAQLFGLYIVVSNVLGQATALQRAINVQVAATTILAALVLWQFPAAGHTLHATVRFGEGYINQDVLGALLILPALAAIALGRGSGLLLGWWRLAALVPLGLAAILTGARGSIIAFAMGLVILAINRPRLGVRAIAIATIIIATFLVIAPHNYVERMIDRYADAGEDRLSGRIDIWKVAIAVIADNPVLGTGFGGFQPVFLRYMAGVDVDPRWAASPTNVWGGRAMHNMYLGSIAELGILGGSLFGAALAAHGLGLWRTLRRTGRNVSQRSNALALAVLTMFSGLIILGLSAELFEVKVTWFVLGIAQGTIFASQPLHEQRTMGRS